MEPEAEALNAEALDRLEAVFGSEAGVGASPGACQSRRVGWIHVARLFSRPLFCQAVLRAMA